MRYSEGGLILGNRGFDNTGGWISVGQDARVRQAEENADPRRTKVPESFFSVVPVIGAVRFLCRLASGCEIHVVERNQSDGTLVRTYKDLPRWADEDYQPNDHQTISEFFDYLSMNMLLGGEVYYDVSDVSYKKMYPNYIDIYPNEKVQYETTYEEWLRMDKGTRKVMFNIEGKKKKLYSVYDTDGDLGQIKLMSLHDPLHGISPLAMGAPTFRAALYAEAHAELMFIQGGPPIGILSGQEQGDSSEENLDRTKRYYTSIRQNPKNRHLPLVLEGKWQWINTFINPEQLQLIDSRRFAYDAAQAVYGVPIAFFGNPEMGTPGTAWKPMYKFVKEHTGEEFLKKIGRGLSTIMPKKKKALLIPEHLKESDPLEMSRVYERYVQTGVMRRNEVRGQMNLPSIPGLDEMPIRGLKSDSGDSDSGRDDGDSNLESALKIMNKIVEMMQ